MLHNIKRVILSALCWCISLVVFFGTAAISAAAVTTLPSGILIGDESGISVDPHGYYYIDARDLKGGEIITKTITIQNLSQNDNTPEGKILYTISVTTEPISSSGPQDLLDKTQLVLKLDGRVIYTGCVRGDGVPNMIETALELGTYKVGERSILDIILSVDDDLQLFEEKSEADFMWKFYAYRASESTSPKTGLLENHLIYILAFGGIVSFFILLAYNKKKREQETNL